MTQTPFHFSDPNLDDKEKLREIATFIKGCARLLQNNTQKLDTYSEFLQDELDDNPRAQDFLKRADDIIKNIQMLSNLMDTQDDVRLEGESMTLSPMLRGVINRCQTLFEKNNIAFELECPEDLSAYGDVLQLQQLVFTIIQRLVNLPSPPATIQVTATQHHCSDSDLRMMGADCKPGNYVDITIHDAKADPDAIRNFINLTDALYSQKALHFQQSDLASWLGVTRRHEGDLLVNAPDGQPAIKLLITQSYASQTLPRQLETQPTPQGQETILLVDDEDMIWDLVIDSLTNLGYTILLASDGQEAIETYQANPGGIDLVIMDMVMPGMNGREAFEKLKKLDPHVKVLLSSGYVSDEDAHFVMKAGAMGFLRKPYSMKKLGITVRNILDQKNTDNL